MSRKLGVSRKIKGTQKEIKQRLGLWSWKETSSRGTGPLQAQSQINDVQKQRRDKSLVLEVCSRWVLFVVIRQFSWLSELEL